jgi:hypothetical protein
VVRRLEGGALLQEGEGHNDNTKELGLGSVAFRLLFRSLLSKVGQLEREREREREKSGSVDLWVGRVH